MTQKAVPMAQMKRIEPSMRGNPLARHVELSDHDLQMCGTNQI
jgi:hypothetical protein